MTSGDEMPDWMCEHGAAAHECSICEELQEARIPARVQAQELKVGDIRYMRFGVTLEPYERPLASTSGAATIKEFVGDKVRGPLVRFSMYAELFLVYGPARVETHGMHLFELTRARFEALFAPEPSAAAAVTSGLGVCPACRKSETVVNVEGDHDLFVCADQLDPQTAGRVSARGCGAQWRGVRMGPRPERVSQ